MLQRIQERLLPKEEYNLVAFSLGCVIAFEVIKKLENVGYTGKVIFVDGSPDFFKRLLDSYRENIDNVLKFTVIFGLMMTFTTQEEVSRHKVRFHSAQLF